EVAGGAALVVPGFDSDEWASQVSRIVQDASILLAMRKQGRERARDFSWKLCAERTIEVYREVAG
ncbi:MAG: glycosyltransferase family 1 protein, partial [Fimbriimonadaceae bacterium]